MTSSKLNVPKTISVGFQERKDTYTGKLAYVVFTDAKGTLRKERSWNSWRDKKIDPKTFDNVPTSGFVLNKKVGDYSSHYGGRMAACRIYDPRDFEFEIKVDNLLFILEETSAIKGKGLDGEFVYSWDREKLVLLPVSSQEYKGSVGFTELQTKKVTKADIREGCLYLLKDQTPCMYLGRHDWYQWYPDWLRDRFYEGRFTKSRLHVFVDTMSGKYITLTGFVKLAARLTEEPDTTFADKYEEFKKSNHGSPPKELVGIPWDVPSERNFSNYWYYEAAVYFKTEQGFIPGFVTKTTIDGSGVEYYVYKELSPVVLTEAKTIIFPYQYTGKKEIGAFESRQRTVPAIDKKTLKSMELYDLFIKHEGGGLTKVGR